MTVVEKIDKLEEKIKSLVETHTAVKEELEIVNREKMELNRQLIAFQKQGVQSRDPDLFAEALPSDTKGLKSQLDQYIDEVDECIDMVNKL